MPWAQEEQVKLQLEIALNENESCLSLEACKRKKLRVGKVKLCTEWLTADPLDSVTTWVQAVESTIIA